MKMRWNGHEWIPRRQKAKKALDFKPKEGQHWDHLKRAEYDNDLYALTKDQLEKLEVEIYQYWTWDDSSKEIEEKWELVKSHLDNLDGHSLGNRFTGSAGPR